MEVCVTIRGDLARSCDRGLGRGKDGMECLFSISLRKGTGSSGSWDRVSGLLRVCGVADAFLRECAWMAGL
jgi:hypothetical protein